MTDYTKLIEALRLCGSPDVVCKWQCPYYGVENCSSKKDLAAADALEALQAQAEHTDQVDAMNFAMHKKQVARIAELEAQNELKDGTITAMATDIGKLQAQMPKDGEWIWENYCWHCSVCGENPTRGMGYVQGKNELFRVCPNCGARMDGKEKTDADYQASVLMQEYFERYEPTYNSEDGSM